MAHLDLVMRLPGFYSLSDWIAHCEAEDLQWIAKRLAGNDTGATGTHAYGIYLPKSFFRRCFPEIDTIEVLNPKATFETVEFPQEAIELENVTATYYNNRHATESGTRNEFRLTNWEGKRCPLLDEENTGALTILAFSETREASIWVCSDPTEEAEAEAWLGGPVEPQEFRQSWDDDESAPESSEFPIPDEWREQFPSGDQIFNHALEFANRQSAISNPDGFLLKLREIEYGIFRQVESLHIMPQISGGFDDLDAFLALANSVTNRRKSRSGRSLELGLEFIFRASGLTFETQAQTENRKRPDFLFPSAASYANAEVPASGCVMLAAKTCCKDRWRQVTDEAEKLETKHLFTLQEGVSVNQLRQMSEAGIQLVIPESNRSSFPAPLREELISLSKFVDLVKLTLP